MFDFFARIFDTNDFPARWNCGLWTSGHGWLHIVSDLATFGAYTAIPCVLAYFVLKRKTVVFPRIFWLFIAFILACGSVHLVEATLFWQPWYRLSGLTKVATAVFSWVTVLALIRVAPEALRLPGLHEVNQKLEAEVDRRKEIESELRRNSAELARRNRELDEYASIVSHDLRSPLRAIDNLSKWITDDVGEELPDPSRVHFDKMRSRVKRMERLLDDLLEYSRAGSQYGEVERIDVRQLCEEIVELLSKPDDFRVELDPDLPTLFTLRTPLETCLRNLLSNAIKHHDRLDGCARVRAESHEDFVDLLVEDDGPGIPAPFRERIFRVFQTLEPKDDVDGNGIGLAIIQRTAEAVGGSISLASGVARGAVFRLRWPRAIHTPEVQHVG